MYTNNRLEEKKISINGPAGSLEAMVSGFDSKEPKANIGIVCHPHPLHQGSMHNKVVTTVIRIWQLCGLATVRFNFRGVGESQGLYGEGVGEVKDLEAVIAWVEREVPTAKLWLAGFSFGSVVSLKVASEKHSISGLISIAPIVEYFDFLQLHRPNCPWLLIHGEEDELVSIEEVRAWYQAFQKQWFREDWPNNFELVTLKGAPHLFHGHLTELGAAIQSFMESFLPKSSP